MSRVSGDLVTCSRCGETIFLAKLGSRDLDGGFSRYDVFEELPDDWLFITQLEGHLCPNCSNTFKQIIADFMHGVSIAPAWRLVPVEKGD